MVVRLGTVHEHKIPKKIDEHPYFFKPADSLPTHYTKYQQTRLNIALLPIVAANTSL